jgi:SpoIID/LytB domain protein
MRFLVAIAFLAALVVPFAPLARTASAATYAASYSFRASPTMVGATSTTVAVAVTNTGTQTWSTTGPNPVNLSYHWLRGDGSMFLWDGDRTSLPHDVPAGATVYVDAKVTANTAPVVFRDVLAMRLQFALVKEGVTWFPASSGQPVRIEARVNWPRQAAISAPAMQPVLANASTTTVDVVVTNKGQSTWPAGGANPVRLSYHLFGPDGGFLVWDGDRTPLTADVAPGTEAADGQTVTLHATVRLLEGALRAVLVWDLVQEGVAWFGDETSVTLLVRDPAHAIDYTAPATASGFTGDRTTLDLTLHNAGTKTWSSGSISGGEWPVDLSYHWRDANGAGVTWDGARTPLPTPIGPGETRTIRMAVDTPMRPGTYTMWIDAVHEGLFWFSMVANEPAYVTWQITNGLGATYGPSNMASSAVSGASIPVHLTLTNSGQQPWRASDTNPLNLSYHIYDAQGRLVIWDGERAPFPLDVLPGQTVDANITVRVPTTTGGYGIGWDLVREGIGWFSDFGVPIRKDIVIVAPGVTFYGKGWGHGVGMSQWGAQGWAQGATGTKKTGEEIIAFYYPGTQLSVATAQFSMVRVLLSSPSTACIARTITNFSQQRSAGGLRVTNEGTGAPITTSTGSVNWAPQQTVRIWVANDGLLHVMDEWSGSQIAAVQGPIRVSPLDATKPIVIDQKASSYRGDLRYAVASQDALRVVNLVGIDDYARGAVPSEMPTGFGWEFEAFKAQAYAAKTYAANLAASRANEPYDVTDDTSDQCYGGATKETTLTNQAVAATAGRIVTYNQQPIKAYYHSSDGGMTERDGCVFDLPSTPPITCNPSQPYLQVNADPADLAASDSRGPNPHRSWSVSVTAQQIVDAVRERTGTDIGSFVALDLSNRAGSGRLISVRVQGTRATVELSGPSFLRAGLGLKSTRVYLSPF